jgi:hypothetical protein
MIRSVIITAVLFWFATGCATQRVTQIHDHRTVAYHQDVSGVRTAYLQAIAALGWEIQHEEEDRFVASSATEDNAAYGIRFTPADTLRTQARIAATYAPYLTHSPDRLEQLLSEVEARLEGSNGPFVYPMAAYPEGTRSCDGPVYRDTTNVTLPRPRDGHSSIMQRFGHPTTALQAGVIGPIFVQFVVDAQGEVECAIVREGLPGGLNEVAIHAIVTSPFEPGYKDGVPTRMMVGLPLGYRTERVRSILIE